VATTTALRQRAVRSAAWSLPTSVGARAVGLLGTLLLARYLAPDDYGAVTAASIAATTASSVTTFGVGIYLVANPGLSRAERFHASCWFLATGAAALLVTLILGGPLERWSGASGVGGFLPMLILSAMLERIVYVPERVLVSNLRFGWLSLARALGELTYTVVSVTLAAYGGGAMAIAWGNLARSVFRFVTIVPAVHIREWLEPHRLRVATLRRIVGYGMNTTVGSMATFGMRRWDNLLISRYFGPGVMGSYNYAYNLADTSGSAIGDQMSEIVVASFPHVDQRRRGTALVHACAMVSLVMFPLSIGLAAVAPTLVATFFDSRWSNVGTMLMCLAVLSAARPLGTILGSYFCAIGRPGVVLRLEWATLVCLVAALATVGRAGIHTACLCVGGVFVLRALAGMWLVQREDGVRVSAFLRPMAGPLAACVVMAATVSAARVALAGLTPSIQLLLEVGLGAVIYTGAVLLIAPSSCHELLRTVRSALRNGSTALPAAAEEKPPGPRVLSLSTEFPNPSEPGKGLFVRARLAAIRSRACLLVVAPVASLDYANPGRDLFAARRIPVQRQEGRLHVLHPGWIYPPYGGWTNAFFLFARLLPMLRRLRSQHGFDVIDAHFAHPEGIAAVLLGWFLRRPVLVTLRGVELRYARQRSKRFWMSWALRRADRVIAVSKGLRELAIDLGVDPQRVRTVPNGINADVFFRRDRVQGRARHGIGPDEHVILSAGDLAELKGHHRAIAAVKALEDHGVCARLLIAGGIGRSGRYAESLRRLVAESGLDDRVAFLGEVTQEGLAELMSAADVFCLASSTEGWPNVVNEALACGTPVVATDVGAVRQMIVGDQYGSVVPVDDAGALTNALRAALAGGWDHRAIAAHGASRSWSQAAAEVLDEVQAILADRSRRSIRPSGSARRAAVQTALQALRARFSETGRP
jgi:lipopolysaccharide exporter